MRPLPAPTFGGRSAATSYDMYLSALRGPLDDQFRFGEFVGDPRIDPNPAVDPRTAAAQLEAGKRSLETGSLENAGVATRMLSDLAEKYIYIDRKPFRLLSSWGGQSQNRRYLRWLYDMCKTYPIGSRNQIWCNGRQTEKSTTQSAKSILLGVKMSAYKTLYVAPRFDQVTVFSSQRFKPMAEDSVALRPWVQPTRTLWQVGAKEFMNGSFYNFRSCYLTADGCRGITAQHLMIDEIQDILSDNIPVLEECQSHYGWETGLRFRSYAGTPKTTNNPLTRRYRLSAQFEWMTECLACNHWNFPDENIIGDDGYVCVKCGRPIFPQRHGRWDPQNRTALDKCWGFRLPQLVVPFKTFADIKEKQTDPNISRLKFYNETLGLPYDEGELVLTDVDLQRASHGGALQSIEQLHLLARNGVQLFAGLDWGTGEGDNPSYTVLAVGHFDGHDRFRVIYLKKFVGKDAGLAQQPALVNDLCSRAGVFAMMADWGFGAQSNARLVADYGWNWWQSPKLLLQSMYVKQRAKAAFDPTAVRYTIDRNQSMSALIDDIKRSRVLLPRFDQLQPFASDFTTIYVEFNETYGTTKFDHAEPDDAFHATNYAYMCGQQFRGLLVGPEVPDAPAGDLGY